MNHEKRLPVDAICANVGIKYSFMYLSVYQLIKQHAQMATSFGKRLLASKKLKPLEFSLGDSQAKDEYNEDEYSAAHFNLDLVVELVCHTIALQRRPYQCFILLEGLCNSGRLIGEDDHLELRFMDELFMIEKHIGEVQAIVGLQFDTEKEYIEENEVEYEVFQQREVVVQKKKPVGEDGEEAEAEPEAPADADDGDKKKPAFRVEDWKWTVTDRNPKNLP